MRTVRMHYVYTNQKPLSRIPDSQIRQKLIRKPQHPSKSLSTSLSIQIRIIPSRSIHVRFLIFHNHFIFSQQTWCKVPYSGETKYSNRSSSRSFKIMWLGESLSADRSWCQPKYEYDGLFYLFWWYRCHRLQSQCCWACTKFGHYRFFLLSKGEFFLYFATFLSWNSTENFMWG